MNPIFLSSILLISISLIPAETIPNDSSPNFFLTWITHETKWPMVIEKSINTNSDADYDWFRSDIQDYVSQSPDYRDNYFIGKHDKKSQLTIFSYNATTHQQLTTYEPMRVLDLYNSKPSKDTQEFHTLTYLKSHRLRIDRDNQNTYANVTCIADFLVDQSSLDAYTDLVEDMKDLALFRVDLEQPNNGDLHQFTQRAEHKKYFQANQDINQQVRYQQRMNRKMMIHRNRNSEGEQKKPYFNIRTRRASHASTHTNGLENKPIMNVRLSFGPIPVRQPIHDRIISCSLSLVNTQKMIMEYDNTVYKFLTSRDLGMDKNAEDILEEHSNSLNTEEVKMDHVKDVDVRQMSDVELNDIFDKQEVVEKIEQEIIKEKGPEKFEAIVTDILEQSKVDENRMDLLERREKAHERRFFEFNNMFMLDKPIEIDLESLNAGNSRYLVNYTVLICVAVLNLFFY